jgi:hypothetical protein
VLKKILQEKHREEGDEEQIKLPDPTTAQLFEIVLAARKTEDPGVSLLYCALQAHRPLLAVIAACFESSAVSKLDCMISWLCASCPSALADFRYSFQSAILPPNDHCYSDTQNVMNVTLGADMKWESWTVHDLGDVVVSLCKQQVSLLAALVN